MKRVKGYIYSLLLLMVTIIGSGVLSCAHCHCHEGCHEATVEHHECHDVAECEGHSSAIEHGCCVDGGSSFEYIVVASQRVEGSMFALCLFATYLSLSVEGVDQYSSRAVAERVVLYDGYDPSTGSLRAPPVLV